MAKPRMIALGYTFLFDRGDNIWNNLFEFENDLSDFFASNNLQAEPVMTVEGSNSNRIMIIKKVELIDMLENEQKHHKGGFNMAKPLASQKGQPSYNTIKKLTNSIGKGKQA